MCFPWSYFVFTVIWALSSLLVSLLVLNVFIVVQLQLSPFFLHYSPLPYPPPHLPHSIPSNCLCPWVFYILIVFKTSLFMRVSKIYCLCFLCLKYLTIKWHCNYSSMTCVFHSKSHFWYSCMLCKNVVFKNFTAVQYFTVYKYNLFIHSDGIFLELFSYN